MIKKSLIFLVFVVLFISGSLAFCGDRVCEVEEDASTCSSDCLCSNVANPIDEIYVDNTGICGECNDYGEGNITQPYCTLKRAFHNVLLNVEYNTTEEAHVFDSDSDRIDFIDVEAKDSFTIEMEYKINDGRSIGQNFPIIWMRRTSSDFSQNINLQRYQGFDIQSVSKRFMIILYLDTYAVISSEHKGDYFLSDNKFHNYTISFNKTNIELHRDGTIFEKLTYQSKNEIEKIEFMGIGSIYGDKMLNSSIRKIKIYNKSINGVAEESKVLDLDFSNPFPDRYLQGGKQLYIRRGEQRVDYDGLSLFDKYNDCTNIFCGGIINNVDAQNPALISGYPYDEKPLIFLSERVYGWKRFSERENANIWYVDWNNLTNEKFPFMKLLFDSWGIQYNPQLVAVHQEEPIILQQVNSIKNYQASDNWIKPQSFRNDQFDMSAGDFYFESDEDSPYYGFLFVWLSDGSDPNTKKMEVGIDKGITFFGNYTTISNLKSYYAGTSTKGFWGGNIGVNGFFNTLDNLDISYNDFSSIGGYCEACVIKNSLFRFTGNNLGSIVGQNNLFLDNIIEYYNYRNFDPSWHAGGIKNVPMNGILMAYSIFRGNTFRHGIKGPALWYDFSHWGHIIENNIFENITVDSGVMIEITNGTDFAPNVIRNNLFSNSGNYSFWGGGIYISASHYNYILHNTFYNLPGGVVIHGYDSNVERRREMRYNKAYNNLFINVAFPQTIFTNPAVACSAPLEPFCYEVCPPTGTSQNPESCTPIEAFKEIHNNSADYNSYYGSSESQLWVELLANPTYADLFSHLSNQSKVPSFCDSWCTAHRYQFEQWQTLNYDNHSLYEVNPKINSNTDFRLMQDSPLIDAGTDNFTNYAPYDYFGISRTESNPDIGAFEYFDYSSLSELSVSLSSPLDSSNQTNNVVLFLCSARSDSDDNVTSMTLYHNASGEWKAMVEKKTNKQNPTIEFYDYFANGTYSYNCLAKTKLLREAFAIKNGTFSVNIIPKIPPQIEQEIGHKINNKDVPRIEIDWDNLQNATVIYLNDTNFTDDIVFEQSNFTENENYDTKTQDSQESEKSKSYLLTLIFSFLILIFSTVAVTIIVIMKNAAKKKIEKTPQENEYKEEDLSE